jgi:hypothetical protein
VANIISSTFTITGIPADGTRIVHEIHIDLDRFAHDIVYTAPAGSDLAAAMADHATSLGADLAAQEVVANMNRAMTLGRFAANVTHFSTPAQNTAALTAAWPTLLNVQAIFIGDYLNTLSDAVLQAVFGWAPAYEANIRTVYLVPYAAMADSIRNATGTL